MTHNNPKLEYLKAAVLTASQEQLHLMLLDGAIRFANAAHTAIEANQIEAAYHALDRAQRIMLELDGGLRRDVNPEVVDRTRALYSFVYRRLVDAGITRDLHAIDDALKVLVAQRETWVLVMEKVASLHAAPTGSLTGSPTGGATGAANVNRGPAVTAAPDAASGSTPSQKPSKPADGPRTTISIEG